MKTWNVHATILANGAKVTTKVKAIDANEAELIAGRRFLEAGFKGDTLKIEKID